MSVMSVMGGRHDVPLPICRGRRGGEGRLPAMEGSMTDRRNEREDERERTEKARERRREDEERVAAQTS
jgi:hypothetical protein